MRTRHPGAAAAADGGAESRRRWTVRGQPRLGHRARPRRHGLATLDARAMASTWGRRRWAAGSAGDAGRRRRGGGGGAAVVAAAAQVVAAWVVVASAAVVAGGGGGGLAAAAASAAAAAAAAQPAAVHASWREPGHIDEDDLTDEGSASPWPTKRCTRTTRRRGRYSPRWPRSAATEQQQRTLGYGLPGSGGLSGRARGPAVRPPPFGRRVRLRDGQRAGNRLWTTQAHAAGRG